jgi:hypothetical protein
MITGGTVRPKGEVHVKLGSLPRLEWASSMLGLPTRFEKKSRGPNGARGSQLVSPPVGKAASARIPRRPYSCSSPCIKSVGVLAVDLHGDAFKAPS